MKKLRVVPVILILGIRTLTSFAVQVGVVANDGNARHLEILVETIQALGHQAEKLPENDLCRPTGLGHYDCIILIHNSSLTESGYKALAEYTREGGTLLLVGMTAYWMKTPDGPRDRVQIRGKRPLKDVAGISQHPLREMPVRRFVVVGKSPAIMGLPEHFEPQTTPPYDIDNRVSWRNAGVVGIMAVSSDVLIKVEALDPDGQTVEIDFLTVNSYGYGQCYWLALSCVVPMLFEKQEKHIALILQNILKNSCREYKR